MDLEVADDEVVAPEHLAPAPGAATAPAATAAPAAAAPAATADKVLPAAAAPANTYIATTVAAKTATVTAASMPATAAAASSSSGAQAGAPHAAGGVGMAEAATPSVPAPGPQAALGQEVQVHASPAVRALARWVGCAMRDVAVTSLEQAVDKRKLGRGNPANRGRRRIQVCAPHTWPGVGEVRGKERAALPCLSRVIAAAGKEEFLLLACMNTSFLIKVKGREGAERMAWRGTSCYGSCIHSEKPAGEHLQPY